MKVEHPPSLRVGTCMWPMAKGWGITVICKACYRYAPASCQLLPESEPLYDSDVRRDGHAEASVQRPADLAPFKVSADVIVTGEAYSSSAPHEPCVTVGLSIGEIDKRLQIAAPEQWTPRAEYRPGELRASFPLDYEYAAGGTGTDNPIGMSHKGASGPGGMPVPPPLQPVGFAASASNAWPEPIGLGPLASNWPVRRAYLKQEDEQATHQWLTRPLAADFDYRFFNVAPLDQRAAKLRPGMPLTLTGLHPVHEQLITKLPVAYPTMALESTAGGFQTLEAKLGTLHIDSRHQQLHLVWYALAQSRSTPQIRRCIVGLDGGAAVTRVVGFSPGTDRSPARPTRPAQPSPNAASAPAQPAKPVASVWGDAADEAPDSQGEDMFATRRIGDSTEQQRPQQPASADPWARPMFVPDDEEETFDQTPYVDQTNVTEKLTEVQPNKLPHALPFRQGTFQPQPETTRTSRHEETGGHTAALDIHALRARQGDSAAMPFESDAPPPDPSSPARSASAIGAPAQPVEDAPDTDKDPPKNGA